MIHLSGHRQLREESPRPGQLCVICNVDPLRAEAVAAYARRTYRQNKSTGIPYAFSSPDLDWFAKDGRLIPDPANIGLTCSNFVLALFRSAGLPLVFLATWPKRKEDADWQQSVIEEWRPLARRRRKRRAVLDALQRGVGTVRCRPVEVCGAALSANLPSEFKRAKRLAKRVESKLKRSPAAHPVGPPALSTTSETTES